MAIDGIRKGPAVGPNTGATAPTPKSSFQVERAGEVSAASKVDAPSLADRVRSGELDLHGFIEAKIDQSTTHLNHLSPEALSDIKEMMRDKMMNDPLVTEWIAELTGKSAPKDE